MIYTYTLQYILSVNDLIMRNQRKCNLIRISKKRPRQRSMDICQTYGAFFMKPPQSAY